MTSLLRSSTVGILGGTEVGRAIKINITLPEEELSLVDVFVQKQGDTRSGLIQQALRAFMEQKEREAREREKREG
ncbi:MAG: ribbon-helix-helix protein, CopG family, partial [Dehalococcoidia bacterium]